MRSRMYCGLAVGLGVVILCAGASAQQYPTKPVRLIVPYAPGGGVDIVARALAQELTRRLGQQIIVDNRTGAGAVTPSSVRRSHEHERCATRASR